jgi:hypothetical protein
MKNIKEILKKKGFEKESDNIWIKELKYNHKVIYNSSYIYDISFSKNIFIGNYSTNITADFIFSTEQELDTLLNNFLHFNSGIVKDQLTHENQSI